MKKKDIQKLLDEEIQLTKDFIEKRYGKPFDEITVDDIYFGTKIVEVPDNGG